MSKSTVSLSILYEDDRLIAVNKQAGILSIPDRFDESRTSLYKILKEKYDNILTVHRLDKDTSGVILFAKTPEVHKELNDLFLKSDIAKVYHAIAEGHMEMIEGIWDAPIAHDTQVLGRMRVYPKGKESITKFKVLESFRSFTLLELMPKTGRTHQIRVHAKYFSHPLVCDPTYGKREALYIHDIKNKVHLGKFSEEVRPLLNRTALHAYSIEIPNYLNGESLLIQADYPKDMKACIQQLRKNQGN